jgi:hypothetical protein
MHVQFYENTPHAFSATHVHILHYAPGLGPMEVPKYLYVQLSTRANIILIFKHMRIQENVSVLVRY